MRGINLKRWRDQPEPNPPESDHAAAADLPEDVDSSGSAGGTEWGMVQLPHNYMRARSALRAAIALPLIVLAGLGVKSAFAASPVQAATSTELPATLSVDTAGAASTAQYVARTWLTLDDPDARTGRLSLVWDNPGEAGWSEDGTLSTQDTYTVSVEPLTAETVDVTVAVYVVSGEEVRGWVGVLVPMQTVDGVASVRGEPKIVGLPDPSPTQTSDTVQADRDLTSASQADIERFFTAWAEGDASGVTAPGVTIPAPSVAGSVTVTGWTVAQGSGDERHGTADISWQVGTATLHATYDVTITKVSAAGGTSSRWQVTSIN